MESPFEKMADETGPSGTRQVAVRRKRYREHSVLWFIIEMSLLETLHGTR